MSNKNTVIVGDTKIYASVQSATTDRAAAVEIALELVKATCAGTGRAELSSAVSHLSHYADRIQAALQEKA